MNVCYLCGCDDNTIRPGKVRDNVALSVMECRSCGLVFLSSTDHIKAFHYEQSGMHGDTPQQIEDWLRESHRDNERRCTALNQAILGKKVLDFGCGAGGFLLKIRSIASEAFGIEPERRLQPHFSKKNLNVWESIERLPVSEFDLITAFHVVEHLIDPRKILCDLAEILSEDGQIVIEVPSSDDALLRIYESKAFSEFTYWSQHLYLFNPATLQMLVKQAGLRLLWQKQVQRYPISNHLYWLAKGLPGGHLKWSFIDSSELNNSYEDALAAIGCCDTIVASIVKK